MDLSQIKTLGVSKGSVKIEIMLTDQNLFGKKFVDKLNELNKRRMLSLRDEIKKQI